MLYRHWFSFFVKWVLTVNLDFRHLEGQAKQKDKGRKHAAWHAGSQDLILGKEEKR